MTPREATRRRTALLESALHYARQGRPVFPLHSAEDGRCSCGRAPCGTDNGHAGKHPRTAHGLLDATTDPVSIQRWWAQWPDANLGLVTGARSGLVVVDVDMAKGGDAALEALIARHGPLPHTPEALTGGGGRHLLFTHPGADVQIRNSASDLGPGLDVRGDGGYIVAPPSWHRSGRAYEWEASSHPDEVPLAPAPDWLLRLVLTPASGNGAGAAPPVDELIRDGTRNATLTSLAGSMRRRGMTVDEILIALEAVNVRRCVPPLDRDELRQIAASVGRYAPAESSAPESVGADTNGPGDDLRTRTWAELVHGPRRPIAYHWPGWIPLTAVALLVGAGETYKSWLAIMLAIATAAGRSLLSSEEGTLRQGPVLYITGENAIEEEARRCQLLQAALGLPDDLPITFLPAEMLNLSRDEDYQAVVTLVGQLQPVLVVVDSAIAVSGVVEEKDNNAVRTFMQTRVMPLSRRHQATVVVIGHSPKPSQQPGAQFTDEHVARGAGDWRNAADVVLYLRRDPSLGASAVVLRHAKVRIGRRHPPLWFTLDETEAGVRLTLGGSYDDVSAQASGVLAKALRAAIELLRGTPGLFASDLVKQLGGAGVAQATARRAVGVLRGQAKHPWPYGPLAGKVFAVVDETRESGRPRLILDPTQLEQAGPGPNDEADAA